MRHVGRRECAAFRGTYAAPTSVSTPHNMSNPQIVRLGVGVTPLALALPVPGPPASMICPLTERSSSPSAPSVIVNVAVWPDNWTWLAAPSVYQ